MSSMSDALAAAATQTQSTSVAPGFGLTGAVVVSAAKEGTKLALANKANVIIVDLAFKLVDVWFPEASKSERGKQLVRIAAPAIVHYVVTNYPQLVPANKSQYVVLAAERALTVEAFQAAGELLGLAGDAFDKLAEIGKSMMDLA